MGLRFHPECHPQLRFHALCQHHICMPFPFPCASTVNKFGVAFLSSCLHAKLNHFTHNVLQDISAYWELASLRVSCVFSTLSFTVIPSCQIICLSSLSICTSGKRSLPESSRATALLSGVPHCLQLRIDDDQHKTFQGHHHCHNHQQHHFGFSCTDTDNRTGGDALIESL